jgi:hypothetical protein
MKHEAAREGTAVDRANEVFATKEKKPPKLMSSELECEGTSS